MINCPYSDQLSIVMLACLSIRGTFNASLFATEGIASVGRVVRANLGVCMWSRDSLGNRLSADLPPSFLLVSRRGPSSGFPERCVLDGLAHARAAFLFPALVH